MNKIAIALVAALVATPAAAWQGNKVNVDVSGVADRLGLDLAAVELKNDIVQVTPPVAASVCGVTTSELATQQRDAGTMSWGISVGCWFATPQSGIDAWSGSGEVSHGAPAAPDAELMAPDPDGTGEVAPELHAAAARARPIVAAMRRRGIMRVRVAEGGARRRQARMEAQIHPTGLGPRRLASCPETR